MNGVVRLGVASILLHCTDAAWAADEFADSGLAIVGPVVARPAGTEAASVDDEVTGEIVVTARSRTESVADVPISITVLGGDRLDQPGTRGLNDLEGLVPNLAIPATGVLGTRQPSIRGIYSPVGAATVGLYVDDTPVHIRPLLFTGSPDPQLFDLERVEVLRGPQGTLFGASQLAGAVRFVTVAPNLREASARGFAEVHNVRGGGVGLAAAAVVGAPIIPDRLSLRTGLFFRRDSGFVDKVDAVSGRVTDRNINDERTVAAKFAVRAAVGPLIVTPTLLYQRMSSNDLPIFESTRGRQRQALPNRQPGRDRFLLSRVAVTADFAGVALTSVSSHFGRKDRRQTDYSTVFGELVLGGAAPGLVPVGGTRSRTRSRQRDVTQEIRVARADKSSPIQWVVGGYYGRSRLSLAQDVVEPGIAGLVETEFGASVEDVFGAPLLPGGVSYRGIERIAETQIAAFGEASRRFASLLDVTAGVRVFRSRLDLLVASAGPYAGPDAATNRIRERRTETPVTPRVALNYRLGKDGLLYASASRGYRAGGANTPVPVTPCAADLKALGRAAAPASYGSDALWNYDAGIKAAIPRARLTVAASVFHIDWSRIQQPIALPNCGFSYVDNLGAARSRGFELEAQLRPLPQLQVFAAVGHVDARFGRTLRSGVGANREGAAVLVRRGDRVPFTPRWSTSAAGEYEIDLGAAGRGFVRADYRYLGAYQRTAPSPAISFDEAVFAGESRSNLDLRAGVAKGGFRVSAFAQNILGDEAIVFNSAELVPATKSPLRQATVRPRRIGIYVELHY